MCLKLKEEITNPSAPISSIDDDFGITFELFLFASKIKKEVCGVLDFLKLYIYTHEEKNHNILGRG